jgi:hypothetical protein
MGGGMVGEEDGQFIKGPKNWARLSVACAGEVAAIATRPDGRESALSGRYQALSGAVAQGHAKLQG